MNGYRPHGYVLDEATTAPRTAHQAAEQLLADGRHVHLVSDAEAVCLSGLACPGTGPVCLRTEER
ncbi:hypothetical protein [Streptomyces sp. NPDC002644]